MQPHLEELLSFAEVKPAVDQYEFHPWLQQPALKEFCWNNGITVQAWAPVMRGRVKDVPELIDIAQRHGKTAAQVSIRWILQSGVTTIPKSVHEQRIIENADVYDFTLGEDEMGIIDSLDRDHRIGSDPAKFARLDFVNRLVRPPR